MTPTPQLGATVDGTATRFEVMSTVAERVQLALFDTEGREHDHVDLHRNDRGSWTARVEGVGAGQRYGFRVHGPGHPPAGHACDPAKLLVDPAARRVAGALTWCPELVAPGVDSAHLVPRSVVIDPGPLVAASERPGTDWDRTVVYEAHVGHLTARHPDVEPEHRGRYGGLAASPMIDHLQRLGVSALELLPVQQFVSERALVETGRRNVWGYNPLAWGAPHGAYASTGGDPVVELREAVAALHDGGIEVWLDVVFNHTCEGSLGVGPILSWRGFDNLGTYRLIPGPDGLVDDDVTGCGNAVDTRSPFVRRLIRECLVRWVHEIGVDGFRFDLAATLIRADDGPTETSVWLDDLRATPELHGIKLVAEPWDLGAGGYALGRFPAPWREWNDRFRNDVRDVWRGRAGRSAAADALTGSAGSLRADDRDATSGINVVTTHDGFTLADLVSYDHPTDGHDQRSWGSGANGPTDDEDILTARRQRQRALLATLLSAQGVPLLVAGDELGRSQGGSANGYTLEPEEWGLDWADVDTDLMAWVVSAVALRRGEPALRRPGWVDPHGHQITWRAAGGADLVDEDWRDRADQPFQVELDGTDLGGGHLLILVALGTDDTTFALPPGAWTVRLDTAWDVPPAVQVRAEQTVVARGPGLVVLRSR